MKTAYNENETGSRIFIKPSMFWKMEQHRQQH